MMLNISSCACWPLAFILWRNVYSDLLIIFKVSYLSFYYRIVRLYILHTIPLLDSLFENSFFHSMSYLFSFLIVL